MTTERANQHALVLLAIGGVVGILFGTTSAFHGRASDVHALPDDAIALVNGKVLREEEYARAVMMLASDKRTDITDADRAHVLNRLIDEELLIQHGIESGLVDSNRTVRKAITQAMLISIVAENTSEQPAADMLRTFYEKNPALFVRSPAEGDVQMTAGRVGEPPAFAEIKEQVAEVYLQHVRDDTLRKYLEWLHSEAEIVLESELLPSPVEGKG